MLQSNWMEQYAEDNHWPPPFSSTSQILRPGMGQEFKMHDLGSKVKIKHGKTRIFIL